MFLKIENQLFNVDNLQYYELSEKNILYLNFKGNLISSVQQNREDFLNFLELMKSKKNMIFLNTNTIGINLNSVNGIYKKGDDVLVYFTDASSKKIDNIDFNFVENKIIGE